MPRYTRFRNILAASWLLLPLESHAQAPAGTTISRTQTLYLMRCGGCHGIEGRSASAVVPDLRDQVGLFLCSAEGRNYMLRVPNVAMSLIHDDASLADVMNFVAFQFGGRNRPANTPPFTAAEVHEARGQPWRSIDLASLRRSVLERAITACSDPPTTP